MKTLFKNFFFSVLLLAFASTSFAVTKDDAVAMVNKGIEYYKANGKDKSIPYFSDQSGPFRNGELFLVVMDLNANVLSHSGMKKMIGANIMDLKDKDGVFMVKDMLEKSKKANDGWSVKYVWNNPEINKMQPKITYFKKHDNLIFFCGIHIPE